MEELIREAYYDYLIENDLEDNQESINMFISYMYYEIQDNLGLDEFYIPSDLEGLQAQIYIEQMIEGILKGA